MTLQILEEGSEARGRVFIRRLDGRRLHLKEGGPKLLCRFYSGHEQAIIPFLPSLSPLSAPLTSTLCLESLVCLRRPCIRRSRCVVSGEEAKLHYSVLVVGWLVEVI